MEEKTDYQKLGFMCGIEIHQQLEGRKLFCGCPTNNSQKEPDIKVIRRLRVSASELGKIDAAAKYEAEKNLYFIYESSSEDTCLVEYDEEPPHPANPEALKTALTVARLLNAKIVDEIHFMRKIVIDGSNTSGFQRTALIALDGYFETSKGRVNVPTICLEEEAAQKTETGKDFVRYRLDRLGIPLIELGTDASIKDPEHAKEAASYLGMVLRSVEGVKRGLGTIRQDLNVSIVGHPRVEIKGFQELRSIPKTIEIEAKRQLSELRLGKKPEQHVRKAEPDFTTTFLRPMPGADRMYPETDVSSIRPDLKDIKLPKLLSDKSGELKELGLSEELATELAKSPKELELFEKLQARYPNIEPKFIAATLISTPKDLKKRYNVEARLDEEGLDKIFGELNNSRISREAVSELLLSISQDKPLNLEHYLLMTDAELEKEIRKIIEENKGLNPNALIGKAMGRLRGKADGKKIVEFLKRLS
jgi:Glu-tRNA(Gln) amidotransferase subunit E-like FAD-binding protein